MGGGSGTMLAGGFLLNAKRALAAPAAPREGLLARYQAEAARR